jgi:hypothetical protein
LRDAAPDDYLPVHDIVAQMRYERRATGRKRTGTGALRLLFPPLSLFLAMKAGIHAGPEKEC